MAGRKYWDEILALRVTGKNGVQIAEVIGISPQATNGYLASDSAKARLAVMRDARDAEVGRILASGGVEAAEYLIDVVDGKDEATPDRIRAANSILDRTGHAKGSKLELGGPDGGPVRISFDFSDASDADLDKLDDELEG